MTKVDTLDPVIAGINLVYTIAVSNTGPGAAASCRRRAGRARCRARSRRWRWGTMAVTGTFRRGGTVIDTVVLTNSGPATQGDNPGDEFVDVLPPGLRLVGATASTGTVGTNLVMV